MSSKVIKRITLLTPLLLVLTPLALVSFIKKQQAADFSKLAATAKSEYASCTIYLSDKTTIDHVLLAETRAQMAKGLSGRIEPSRMLFRFAPPDEITLWMKDTHFDIVAYLFDDVGALVETFNMYANTDTFHMSETKVRFVLELPQNEAQKFNIKQSTKIKDVSCPLY